MTFGIGAMLMFLCQIVRSVSKPIISSKQGQAAGQHPTQASAVKVRIPPAD